MTKLTLCGSISIALLLGASLCLAQENAEDIALQQRAIVRVGSSTSAGSGIVVAVEPDRVRIITARHVVEGTGPRQNAQPQSRRECNGAPVVSFEFAAQTEFPASSATCTDEDDLALLEVPFQSPPGAFPDFKQPRPLMDKSASRVNFLGRAWSLSDDNVVVSNDAESSENGRLLTTQGRGVQPGFSGGAVLDVEGGLVGMVLRTSPTLTSSLRRERINQILTEWGVKTNRLEGFTTEDPNPAFRIKAVQNVANEGARNAVRQYRAALVGKNREALSLVYPGLRRATIDALFGDAVKIQLYLNDCTDLSGSNSLSCEYQLTVFRRTASERTLASRCYRPCPPSAESANGAGVTGGRRMAFIVRRDPSQVRWVIESIQ